MLASKITAPRGLSSNVLCGASSSSVRQPLSGKRASSLVVYSARGHSTSGGDHLDDEASSRPHDVNKPFSAHSEIGGAEEALTYPPAHWQDMFKNMQGDPTDSWDFTDDAYVPPPANLPTNERIMRRGHIDDIWTLTDQPGIDLLHAATLHKNLDQVYVILFGVGERDTEGIYSLRAFSDETGLPQETIIVFEDEDDAMRYASLLEATMDHTPNVCSIPPPELVEFCTEHGYSCRLEPHGSLLIPPDYNVGVTDWERSMRLRDGRFAVLDEEPESGPASMGHGHGSASATAARHKVHIPPQARPAHGGGPGGRGGFSGAGAGAGGSALARYHSGGQLEAIRAQLERLLPSDDSSSAGRQ
uniref:Uncharacterized protein n=1 Tax=Chlamydomonas leiostraca TaxID=1034604 RepID=A0A6T8PRJ0_9CHLO|mmetsp:Transcript_10023/g.25030  ORF Transcript_10023/g.25030 Transcript_10023/m.25030 type:complete len:359 (+) Transcript_10023:147-1223(+)